MKTFSINITYLDLLSPPNTLDTSSLNFNKISVCNQNWCCSGLVVD